MNLEPVDLYVKPEYLCETRRGGNPNGNTVTRAKYQYNLNITRSTQINQNCINLKLLFESVFWGT